MSSVMTTARSVNERFLGFDSALHGGSACAPGLGHPQRPRCLIWYLTRPAMDPHAPTRAAGIGYGRWLASLRTIKLRTYASMRHGATALSRPGP